MVDACIYMYTCNCTHVLYCMSFMYIFFICMQCILFFALISSSELIAQMIFSDHLMSVVLLSVNFYIFIFFSNQTWHKPFLGKGKSRLVHMKGHALSPSRDNYEIAKLIDNI